MTAIGDRQRVSVLPPRGTQAVPHTACLAWGYVGGGGVCHFRRLNRQRGPHLPQRRSLITLRAKACAQGCDGGGLGDAASNQVTRRMPKKARYTPREVTPRNAAPRSCSKVARKVAWEPTFGLPPPPDLRGICGLIWAKSSQHCPTLSNVSRTLANFGQPRPNIHLFGPTLAKLDPTLSNFGQHRPLLAQLGQDCPPKPIAGEHWQNSGRSSAPAATSEQLWAMLGQLWGSPGVAFWNFREEV